MINMQIYIKDSRNIFFLIFKINFFGRYDCTVYNIHKWTICKKNRIDTNVWNEDILEPSFYILTKNKLILI